MAPYNGKIEEGVVVVVVDVLMMLRPITLTEEREKFPKTKKIRGI